jgi:hypothetical protein
LLLHRELFRPVREFAQYPFSIFFHEVPVGLRLLALKGRGFVKAKDKEFTIKLGNDRS